MGEITTEEVLAERREVVYDYLDMLSDTDKCRAENIADQILPPGAGPLANTVVIVPVAAHQEAPQIPVALAEYARQQPQKPFSVVLGLNCPAQLANEQTVQASWDAIERAKSVHADLDIRQSFTTYRIPIIGNVRRDLWNGVAIASQRTGNFDDGAEVVGINHDIDLVRMARTGIARVQQRYERLRNHPVLVGASPIFGTRIKHAPSPEHPNLSRAVFWSDFAVRKSERTFEAGLVIPMAAYAKRGGFNRSDACSEALRLIGDFLPHVLRGTNTETSIRRYIHFAPTHGLNVWRKNNMTADAAYRETNDRPDISRAKMHEMVADSLADSARNLIDSACVTADATYWRTIKPGDSRELEDDITTLIRKFAHINAAKQRALGGRILTGVLDAPQLLPEWERLMSEEAVEGKLVSHLFIYKSILGN